MQRQSSFRSEGPCLYLVPTPIGNLEDMTLRAIRILKEVDVVLAEDTRQTQKLLKACDIETTMQSFHDHSSDQTVDYWLHYIQAGHQVALVSDAGMPLINDPGHPLVQALLDHDLSVISLPGANAALTALVASGLAANQFTYYGFFPRKNQDQIAVLTSLRQRVETAIFYESPHRLHKCLQSITEHVGPQTPVVVARELTKKFEEYLRGTAEEVLAHLNDHPIKGECVVLIEGPNQEENSNQWLDSDLSYQEQVQALIDQEGLAPKDAIKEVAQANQVKKQVVYKAYHQL